MSRRKLDLREESLSGAIRNVVVNGVTWRRFEHTPDDAWQALHDCTTQRYTLVDPSQIDLSRQQVMWSNIAPTDYVLLRGLSSLIKADMLVRHSEFTEEAVTSCFIALEASFRLVVRKLKEQGIQQPTAHDAAQWLHEHFDQHLGVPGSLERYFEEFYEQRIQTLHPESRHGAFPYALLMYDDYSHLRQALRSVFAYLISGKHDRGFLRVIAGRVARRG